MAVLCFSKELLSNLRNEMEGSFVWKRNGHAAQLYLLNTLRRGGILVMHGVIVEKSLYDRDDAVKVIVLNRPSHDCERIR